MTNVSIFAPAFGGGRVSLLTTNRLCRFSREDFLKSRSAYFSFMPCLCCFAARASNAKLLNLRPHCSPSAHNSIHRHRTTAVQCRECELTVRPDRRDQPDMGVYLGCSRTRLHKSSAQSSARREPAIGLTGSESGEGTKLVCRTRQASQRTRRMPSLAAR